MTEPTTTQGILATMVLRKLDANARRSPRQTSECWHPNPGAAAGTRGLVVPPLRLPRRQTVSRVS